MTLPLTRELTDYVREQLATNSYASQEELLVDALRVHRELSTRHTHLRNEIREAIASLDGGEGRPHSMDDVKDRLAERFQPDNQS